MKAEQNIEKLVMPPAEVNGFVRTLNNMGYMTSGLDEFSQKFVDFSATQTEPALDIGAAYGIASKAALDKGAKVIINDIEARHLDIFENTLPTEQVLKLTKMPGNFLELDIQPNSVSSILVCRVLHFMRGETIEQAARLLYKWVKKGGRVFIVCETPYLRNFQNFIPIYEQRRKQNEQWPGFIDDVMKIAPERGAFLPKEMHLLDPEVLSRVFESVGFKTVDARTIARKDFPEDIQLDGRESVGYVGEK